MEEPGLEEAGLAVDGVGSRQWGRRLPRHSSSCTAVLGTSKQLCRA